MKNIIMKIQKKITYEISFRNRVIFANFVQQYIYYQEAHQRKRQYPIKLIIGSHKSTI